MVNDRYYPKEQLDKDLQTIREMELSVEDKSLKGRALMFFYYNQEKEWMFDHMSVADVRENILGK